MAIATILYRNTDQAQLQDWDALVRLRSPPIDGKANEELLKLLAKYYLVRRSQISILHGQTGREKLVHIDVD